jgi:thymidylate synthase
MYLNFWIDHTGAEPRLCMKVQMRSNDIFYGLSYDAPFFAFVQQTVWHWLRNTYENLQLGDYYHCADNIHYYEAHFDLASKISQEVPRDPTYFLLKESMFFCKDGQFLLLPPGQNFLKDVNELLQQRSESSLKRDEALGLIKKYFWLQ